MEDVCKLRCPRDKWIPVPGCDNPSNPYNWVCHDCPKLPKRKE